MADKNLAKITGTVVLVKSDVVGFNDFIGSFLDGIQDLFSSGITFQLVSATVGDPSTFFIIDKIYLSPPRSLTISCCREREQG